MTVFRPSRGIKAPTLSPSSPHSQTPHSHMLAEHELVITRLINAPRERVFKAWTDPAALVHWWGPHGFTTPVCELDVRPGGAFRIHMQSPEGEVYPILGAYREVVPPERLVYSDDWADGLRPSQQSHVTVLFADQGGKTLLTVRPLFGSVEERDAMQAQGLVEGWTEGLERLESHLITD